MADLVLTDIIVPEEIETAGWLGLCVHLASDYSRFKSLYFKTSAGQPML
jgi:hypothetical protein